MKLSATALPLCMGAVMAAPFKAKPVARAAAESWTIPTLSTHFMGSNSGLPGGQWPESSKFNTTISFSLQSVSSVDQSTTVTGCSASWEAGPPEDFPKTWIACSNEDVSFKFDEATYTGPYKFTLQIQKQTEGAVISSEVAVTANDASVDTSYLSCLGGAPLTGIHCDMNGPMSKPGPISLVTSTN